ncbi:MAG: hypothetical protein ACE5FN_10575 [Leptospirillia bacterium]
MSCWLAVVAAGCATPSGGGLRPTVDEFDSAWVTIDSGGMAGEPGGGVRKLNLLLHNKTAEPIWVRVRFRTPAPNPGCEEVQMIGADQTYLYTCVQQTVVADLDYPVTVESFGDAKLGRALEQRETRMRFGKQGIAALEAFIAPVDMPARFDKVVHVEKFGLGSALFGDLFNKTGTLVVDVDAITYTAGDVAIDIPMSAVKAIDRYRQKPPPTPAWVVVKYTVSGQERMLGLNSSAFAGSTDMGDVYRALVAAQTAHARGR